MRKLLISMAGTAFVNLILVGGAWAQSLFGAASVQPADPMPPDVGRATLYRINTSTGAAARVGSIGFNNVDGIAFHPVTRTLYGVGYRPVDNVPVLLTISRATGSGQAIKPITNPSGDVFCSPVGTACQAAPDDIAFRSDGTLFAIFGSHLATINTTTGEATLVRAFAVVNGFALNLTFSPTSPPAVLTLIDAETFLVRLDSTTGDTIETVDLNFAFPASTFYALASGPEGTFATRNLNCCVSTGLDLVSLGGPVVGPTVDGMEALAWLPPNTPAGPNVVVQSPPVTITFDNVTRAGETTVTTLTVLEPPPPGFGATSIRFDATTTALFTPFVTVCVDYSSLSVANEKGLRLEHFETPTWVNITETLDTVAKVICGRVTSLSPFAIFEPIGDATPTVPFDVLEAKVEIDDEELELKATFTLGAASDGIDPLGEVVSLQVGSFSTTIPAGSFRSDKKGRFKFEGVIDGVELEVVVRPRDGARFELKAEAKGAVSTGNPGPLTVRVAIGDDAGTTTAHLDDDDHDDHDDHGHR